MTSARYSYVTVSPSDRASLKRPHSELSTLPSSTSGTPRAKPPAAPTSTARTPSIPSAAANAVPTGPDNESSDHQIFQSAPLHDRKSTFTAYFSPTLPPLDLQSLPEIASASHKILAYRIPESSPLSSAGPVRKKAKQQAKLPFATGKGGAGAREALQTGQDDDGETYGGKHVAKVLSGMDAVGSLVVARWYGGVMLGPVRFAHMESVGREAVEGSRRPAGQSGSGGQAAVVDAGGEGQGLETETPEAEKKRLVEELVERDGSILSLRKLLGQKKGILEGLEGKSGADGEGKVSQPSPQRKMDYPTMPLERLRALDVARDKTVGFLLKQIDEVEKGIESWQALMEAKDDEDDEFG